jgi:hypothetical protein
MEEKIKEINGEDDKLIKNRIIKFGDNDVINKSNLKFNSYILKYKMFYWKIQDR